MIFFLYGSDTYRLQKKLKEIIDYFKKKEKTLIVKTLDLKETDFTLFKKEIFDFSIFQEKKLFVLKNATLNEKFKNEFQKEIEKFEHKNKVIIFVEEKEIKSDSFFEKIKKIGKFQEFLPLDKYKLKWWLNSENQKKGFKIEGKAIDKLIEIFNNDLWQIENEILKLSIFKKGETITIKDVEEFVDSNVEFDVFKIIDNAVNGNKKEALKQIKGYVDKGENLSFLFLMLKRHFRNILNVKDLEKRNQSFFEIKSKSGLHPFEIKKILSINHRFSFEKLKKIYNQIFKFDVLIKTGRMEAELAFDLILFQV